MSYHNSQPSVTFVQLLNVFLMKQSADDVTNLLLQWRSRAVVHVIGQGGWPDEARRQSGVCYAEEGSQTALARLAKWWELLDWQLTYILAWKWKWASLPDKFDQFWAVNRRLMESGPEDGFKNIPVRMFDRDQPLLQRLYKSINDEKKKRTVRDLVRDAMPDREPDEGIYSQARFHHDNIFFILLHFWHAVTLVTQGIEPPPEAPLQWLSEHLSYPDNFLYICVK